MAIEGIATGSFAVSENTPKCLDVIRVVNWNIARGSQLDAITKFLASTNADLILLQEADTNARRTGHRNIAEAIAKKLRMNYAFGIEFEELAQGRRGSPAYHGQATLSRFSLSNSRILRFRKQSKFWHPYWWTPRLAPLQRRRGGRMALLSHVTAADRTLAVYNLHLESRNGDGLRRSQIGELLEDARQYGSDVPVILAGDFNLDLTEPIAAPAFRDNHFQNVFSDERMRPTQSRFLKHCAAIDWILVRGPLKPASPQVHTSISASDHYPLSLTLQFS